MASLNYYIVVLILSLIGKCLTDEKKITDEKIGAEYLKEINHKLGETNSRLAFAQWNFDVNITDENEKLLVQTTAVYNKLQKEIWKNTTKFDYSKFTDENVKRQFRKLSVLGISALTEADSGRFTNISTQMEKIYSEANVCIKGKCKLDLEPDLTQILSKSRDYDELTEVWVNWRNAVGKKLKPLYKEYVDLGNKAAVLNGFHTLDDLWIFDWESNSKEFKEQMEVIWKQIEGFYMKLHAYVRMKLKKKYASKMPNDGTIPAHLLGNMWAQTWSNVMDLVVPYQNKSSVDVSSEMVKQNYTALRMFKLSDKFYKDLGLIGMNEPFWKDSMIVKPSNRKVVCHASAWDLFNQKDFRIKMCTDVTMEDLVTIHHEMGHIEYFMQYKNQPVVYRDGANPGFHEAIGDLMALSVSTPGHLHKIGLLNNLIDDNETTINYQMMMALDKLAFLPFGYLMDLWRWDVFSGKTNMTNWNRRWWELRIKYQGISPPVKRSETDFDPGAKYHIAAGVEYIRYFASHILQFSFHKALCGIAQPGVELHKCDIDGNKDAGKKFAKMLALGSSKPWPEQLELITGNKHMSAQALIEYFHPLIKFLDEQLKGEKIGWTNDVNQYMEHSIHQSSFIEKDTDDVHVLVGKVRHLEKEQDLLRTKIELNGIKIYKLESDLQTQQTIINRLIEKFANGTLSH